MCAALRHAAAQHIKEENFRVYNAEIFNFIKLLTSPPEVTDDFHKPKQ